MAREKIRIALITLAFTGATACAGEQTTTPPQTPAGQTMTTGAATTTQTPPSPTAGEAPPASAVPGETSNLGANSNPTGLRSPLDVTAGTSPAAGASATGAGGPTTSDDGSALSDGEIVAIVQTADLGEIAQARVALQQAKSARVKQFAEHMMTDHSAAEATLTHLDSTTGIAPEENAVTAQLKAGSEGIMGELKTSGAEFDRTYIDAQVREHAQVLGLLDDRLIPHAQNADLTKTLRAVRSKVAGHLKMAKDIQSTLVRAR
jgi:putative membrane protein